MPCSTKPTCLSVCLSACAPCPSSFEACYYCKAASETHSIVCGCGLVSHPLPTRWLCLSRYCWLSSRFGVSAKLWMVVVIFFRLPCVLFCLPVNYIHAVLWSPCHTDNFSPYVLYSLFIFFVVVTSIFTSLVGVKTTERCFAAILTHPSLLSC